MYVRRSSFFRLNAQAATSNDMSRSPVATPYVVFMGTTILRQWMVLVMLPRPPRRIDTASIEARLRDRGIEVHRRTIQRDLLELAELFPIVADERAKPYGWRWSEDASGILPLLPRQRTGLRVNVSLRMPRTHLSRVLEVFGTGDYELIAVDEPFMTVTITVDNSRLTRRAIFGLCDEVEVLTPGEWRRETADRARRVLAMHAP
jgi:hypothetical protein